MTNINDQLNYQPVEIFTKDYERCETANLGDTQFIKHYRGCGRGVAYVEEVEGKLFLRAFNYGSAVRLTNYRYTTVEMSCTQLCFFSGINPSIEEQKATEKLLADAVANAGKVTIFGNEFSACKADARLEEHRVNWGLYVRQMEARKLHRHDKPFRELCIKEEVLALLPQTGAYHCFILDKSRLSLTKWGPCEIPLEYYRFYIGDDVHCLLIEPDVQAIEKAIEEKLQTYGEEIAPGVRVRFVYNYPKLPQS